jgi:hypothetical protein
MTKLALVPLSESASLFAFFLLPMLLECQFLIEEPIKRTKKVIMRNSNKQLQRMKDLSLNTYTLSAPLSGY